jgi:hypothetical protein
VRACALGLSAIIASGPCFATTGADLLRSCREVDRPAGSRAASGYCMGYVSGALDGWLTAQGSGAPTVICVPRQQRVTNEQLALIVAKDLRDHPGDLHEPANVLVLAAFIRAFPCRD